MESRMGCKISRFVHIVDEADRLILYNAWSGMVVCIQPHIRVEDIICMKNEKSESIRKYLLHHKFIVDVREDEKSRGWLKYFDTVYDRTLSWTLMPTEQCNFRCEYCYEDFKKGEMSQSVVNGLVKYLKKNLASFSRLHVEWFGGEPLLAMGVIRQFSQKAIEISRKARKTYSSGMTTNGYLLTADMLNELVDYHVYSYQITLDGTREYHDRHRKLAGGKGSFDQILDNLLSIRDKCKNPLLKFAIRMNVSEENYENIDSFMDVMGKEFGDDDRFGIFFRPVGDWGGDRVENMRSSLLDSSKPILKKVALNLDKGKRTNLSPYLDLLNSGVCYAGKRNHAIIGSDGMVYKCSVNFDNEVNQIGQVYEDGQIIVDKQKLSKWITPCNIPDKCNECFSASECPGGQCAAQRIGEKNANPVVCGYEKADIDEILGLLCDSSEKVVQFNWEERNE